MNTTKISSGSTAPFQVPTESRKAISSLQTGIFCLVLIGLYFISKSNFLLFHSITELFSISVAFAVFMLVWNSKMFVRNDALVMLGIAYLFIGTIDLFHTLAYKGMGVFPRQQEANLATQLWIAARYLESSSLLFFCLHLGKSVNHNKTIIFYGLVTSALLAVIFFWPVFPACFIEGQGLTPFKKFSEYLICMILLVALFFLWRNRHNLSKLVLQLMFASILLTIAGELAFTFYISVYGLSNLAGHYFKILSFLLVYIALIQSGLTRPYTEMFRELNRRKEELDQYVSIWGAFSENYPYPIMMFDAEGRFQIVNQATADLIGKERAEVEGKLFSDVLSLQVARNYSERLNKLKATGSSMIVEEIISADDGSLHDYRTSFFPLRNTDSQVQLFGGLSIDITEQRVKEEMLRLSEHKFATAYHHSPLMTGLSTIDEGKYLDVNDTFLKETGFSKEEVIGTKSVDLGLINQEDRNYLEDLVKRKGHFKNIEMTLTTKMKQPLHCILWGHLVNIDNKPALLVMAQNETEKKIAEQALRESEVKYRSIFHNTPVGIFHYSNDFLVTACNDRFLQFLNISKNQAVGAGLEELLADEGFSVELRKSTALGSGYFNDTLSVSTSDTPLNARIILRGILNHRGDFVGGTGLLEDTTIQRAAERTLKTERALLETRLRLRESFYNISIDDLLKQVLDETEQLVDSSISFFHSITDDEKSISLEAWSSNTLEYYCEVKELNRHYPVERAGVWADCIRERKAVIHNNYQGLLGRKGLPDGHAPVTRQLVVPVFQGEKIVAILGVGNKSEEYVKNDISILTTMANLAWDFINLKKSKTQLDESKRARQTLVENLPGIAFRCNNDHNWTMEYMSGSTFALTGYSPDELMANRMCSYADLIVPEDRDRVWTTIQNAIHDHQQYEIEYRIRKRDNTLSWLWEKGTGVWGKNGTLQAIEGFITDVSEQYTRKQELQRLASAVDHAAESIIITDPEGNIQYVNPAFSKVTGFSVSEAIGSKPSILKSGKHDTKFYQELWGTISSGRVWSGRLLNKKKDGSLFTEEGTIAPVVSPEGRINNFVAVKRDITEKIESDKQISQTQKMEAIGTLAGGIAHDFNNILGPILGYTEMLQEDLVDIPNAQSDLNNIMLAANRAKELVEQILSFSRQQGQSFSTVKIQNITKEVLKLMRSTLPSTIEIVSDIEDTAKPVWADPTQIHQVLMNLITNAYHAMEEKGGTLSVRLFSQHIDSRLAMRMGISAGMYTRLTISDTGKGMGKDMIGDIFSPYFTTKPEGKGTGLGLSVTHGIIKSYNGTIHVESERGEGSTFSVYIPSLQQETGQLDDSQLTVHKGNREHLLVVDDEGAVLEMLKRTLQRLNFKVTSTIDSTDAFKLFCENPSTFDMIITDMTMPHLTGLELSQKIKQITPNTPIIICTGFSEQIDPEKAQQAGIDGFVFKPVLKKDLSQLINQLLHQRTNVID